MKICKFCKVAHGDNSYNVGGYCCLYHKYLDQKMDFENYEKQIKTMNIKQIRIELYRSVPQAKFEHFKMLFDILNESNKELKIISRNILIIKRIILKAEPKFITYIIENIKDKYFEILLKTLLKEIGYEKVKDIFNCNINENKRQILLSFLTVRKLEGTV